MFTGIVEETGSVVTIFGSSNSKILKIKAKVVLENTIIGDSISINGVCQTVITMDSNSFTVDVLKESLTKTTLGNLKPGKKVNLERAITMNRPLGGHIVQGHVQGTAIISSIKRISQNTFLHLKLPVDLMRYMVKEGSVAIDGLSLTIADIKGLEIVINIIPFTLQKTTINLYRVGETLNIEPDILIKTVLEKKTEGLTRDKLLSWGY